MRNLGLRLGYAGMAVAFAAVCISALPAQAEGLFKVGDKTYSVTDLEAKYKLKMHQAEEHFYREKKVLIEEAALELYFEKLAKEQNKPANDIRKAKLEVPDPSEKELKAFYEENRARIPYPFEQIKDRLVKFWKDSKQQERMDALIKEIEQPKVFGFQSLAVEPVAPQVTLNVAGYPSKGSSDAKVTIVEFADYKCPHCKHAFEAFHELVKKYSNKIKFVFVDFPIIADSHKIAEAAYCAQKAGRYWEFHNYAYENQGKFKDPEEIANAIKLDLKPFQACVSKREGKEIVEAGRKEGERVGVTGTPAIFINGFKYNSGLEKDMLMQAIEDAIAGKKYAS